MTKSQALQTFFSSFGMAAYTSTSVPDDVIFPYLTYDHVIGVWGGEPVSITANLWYYTESEAVPNAKVEEISAAIGYGGKPIPCDGGYILLRRGAPWCQSINVDANQYVKRRYLNITAEFMTKN